MISEKDKGPAWFSSHNEEASSARGRSNFFSSPSSKAFSMIKHFDHHHSKPRPTTAKVGKSNTS